MSIDGLSKARLDRMHHVMAGYVERGEVPGLVTLVSRRGEMHIDAIGTKTLGGSDPMRRDTIFRIASMTKPITAAAAMILVEECKLRLDEPVERLLPEMAHRRVLRKAMKSAIWLGSRRNSGIAGWPVTMPSASASSSDSTG